MQLFSRCLSGLREYLEREPNAQYNLGLKYEKGEGVDRVRAIEWFHKAAEQEYAPAQFRLGWVYAGWSIKDFAQPVEDEYHLGVTYDNSESVVGNNVEAVKWFHKAAEQGYTPAQFRLGEIYEKGRAVDRNDTEAVKWFRKAAEQGYAPAQYNLGETYIRGSVVDRNDKEAVKWMHKAAEQGYASAQFSLGDMYHHGTMLGLGRGFAEWSQMYDKALKEGWYVDQDVAEAIRWYRKAAKQGHANAQYNLGKMYEKSEGVAFDFTAAIKWYCKAAEQGHVYAQYNLGEMYESTSVKDYAEAAKWYRKAAGQGYAPARHSLGEMYENGRGVDLDFVAAIKHFRKAAERGDTDAQFLLGVIYQHSRHDDLEAAKWYNKAAEQGHADAQFRLGWIYANDRADLSRSAVEKYYEERYGEKPSKDLAGFIVEGVVKNVAAVKWYNKAAEQGHLDAQFHLGWMYARGRGIDQDNEEAAKWYNKAAKQRHAIAETIPDYSLSTE